MGQTRSFCLWKNQSQEIWAHRDLQEVGVVGSDLKGSSDESLSERSREAFALKSPFYDDHKGEFCMIDPGIDEISQ